MPFHLLCLCPLETAGHLVFRQRAEKVLEVAGVGGLLTPGWGCRTTRPAVGVCGCLALAWLGRPGWGKGWERNPGLRTQCMLATPGRARAEAGAGAGWRVGEVGRESPQRLWFLV